MIIDAIPMLEDFLGLKKRLPRAPLGGFPTPVTRLDRLGRELELELYCKRDGLAGSVYGSSKVRKLELLIGDAIAKGSQTLVTLGAVGSHQILATAAYGNLHGLATIAVTYPQPVTRQVLATASAFASLGVKLYPVAAGTDVAHAVEDALASSELPYLVPSGGSTPLGNLGCVAAAFELRAQIDAGLAPCPQVVVLATGTAGTAAGLALGFHLARIPAEIVAIHSASAEIDGAAAMRSQIDAIRAFLRRRGTAAPIDGEAKWRVESSFLGQGYGVPTDVGAKAGARFLELEGIELEPTYTEKVAAAITAHARSKEWAGKVVLFWETCSARRVAGSEKGDGISRLPETVRRWLSDEKTELIRDLD